MLRESIISAAGDAVKTQYQTKLSRTDQWPTFISTKGGQLPCNAIYFVKWKPDTDEAILKKSIIDFIHISIENLASYGHISVAFPVVGCGQYSCPIDLVISSMLEALHNELTARPVALEVKIVVLPHRQNIYNDFCKQLSRLQTGFV
jgi:hypothetical protein